MLAPLRHTPPPCPVDRDLAQHLDMLDAEAGREAAIEALVKSDYIDIDLTAEGGFVEDFITEQLPAIPTDLAKKLAHASLGYKCQHSYGRSTSTDAACLAAGRVLLDWLYDQAYEAAAKRVDAGDC